jgi:hypothetical protein
MNKITRWILVGTLCLVAEGTLFFLQDCPNLNSLLCMLDFCFQRIKNIYSMGSSERSWLLGKRSQHVTLMGTWFPGDSHSALFSNSMPLPATCQGPTVVTGQQSTTVVYWADSAFLGGKLKKILAQSLEHVPKQMPNSKRQEMTQGGEDSATYVTALGLLPRPASRPHDSSSHPGHWLRKVPCLF